MKRKTFISIVMCAITFASVVAQTEKGRFVLGANSSFTVAETNGETFGEKADNITTIKFMPSASYFLFDNFSTGLAVGYDYQSSVTGADVSVLSEFRYYITKSIVRPYVKANVGYTNINKDIIGHQYEYNASLHGLKVIGGAGIAVFLKDNISLDITGQYTLCKLNDLSGGYFESSTNKSYKVKTTTQGLNLFFGLSFYL